MNGIRRLYLMSIMLLSSIITMWADGVTVITPQKAVGFRTNTGNTAWNSGFPKDASSNAEFEANYGNAGMFVMLQYQVSNLAEATSIKITLTASKAGTAESPTALSMVSAWLYEGTWPEDNDAATIIGNVTTSVGLAPRSTEGTSSKTPLATSPDPAGYSPDELRRTRTITIDGEALQAVKNAAVDGKFTIIITDNKLVGNNSRKFCSTNEGNPEDCRLKTEIVVETPTAVLNGIGYSSLQDAIAAAPTIEDASAEAAVITLNKSVELAERLNIESKNITVKAAEAGVKIARASEYKKLVFLPKDALATITLEGIILDGQGIEAETAFIESSNGKTVLKDVTFTNCISTGNQGSTIANKNKGNVVLENVAFDNCSITGENAARGIFFIGTNGVTLKGNNTFTNCPTALYIENKYTINATEATHTTPVSVIIEEDKRTIGNFVIGGKADMFSVSSAKYYLSQQGNDIYLMPATTAASISHPAMLHSQADIDRVKGSLDTYPIKDAYAHLLNSKFSNKDYQEQTANLADGYLKRLDKANWGPEGTKGQYADYENYTAAMKDANAAYQLALRYTLTGDAEYANAAIGVLNAWKNNCKGMLRLSGYVNNIPDPNEYLALIQGYQFANAAELLRGYNGWAADDFDAFKTWMRTTYAELALLFLENHHGNQGTKHYWLNWDLTAMNAILSTGILCDDKTLIDYAINYFKNTESTEVGAIHNAVPYIHQDTDSNQQLGQCQESGRDQGHSTLDVSLMGVFCQMAKNIGEDLFAYDNYRALNMAEYVAKYNLIKSASYNKTSLTDDDFEYNNLPFTDYIAGKDGEYSHSNISSDSRGDLRPCWELFYGYAKSNNVAAAYSQKWCELVRSKTGYGDGGAGDYGTTSGGFDQLGYGTLMFSIVEPQPENPETGIDNVNSPTENVTMHSLSGYKVNKTIRKGIYITKGRKTIQ